MANLCQTVPPWNWAVTVLIVATTVVTISGCQFGNNAEATQKAVGDATATVSLAQLQQKAEPTLTPSPTATPEDATLVLGFWTVEQISPLSTGPTGPFIDNNIRAFEQANPNLKVDLLIKKPAGKGSALDFLRTAKDVAPAILPDVVILNATDLEVAFQEGLIQSLDGRLDRSIVQDLLPAARRVGTIGNTLAGVPLGLDMEHTLYNTSVFTTAPLTWDEVLNSHAVYLFPAKGANGRVNDVTLSQYLSTGGQIANEQGLPTIDNSALSSVLNFYQQANENQLLTPFMLEAATTAELLPAYIEGQADMVQISVRQYLTDREILQNSLYSALPVKDQAAIPVSVTPAWVLVLVTADVNRQDAALRLMETFLSTQNNATWNQINKSIPIRDSAYQIVAQDDPYWLFLTQQLNNAVPEPRAAGYDQMGRIIQQAVEQVLRGEATAAEAANTAVDALSQ